MEDITPFFHQGIQDHRFFQFVKEQIFRNVNGGKVWAIGGAVYKPILEAKYGLPRQKFPDFDFIVEKPKRFEDIRPAEGWSLTQTSFGAPRFIRYDAGEVAVYIDMLPLDEIKDLDKRPEKDSMTRDQKLGHYLDLVPLNIQSIAYDFEEDRIIGNKGIEAVLSQELRVTNRGSVASYEQTSSMKYPDFMIDKARELNFTMDLTEFFHKGLQRHEFYNVVLNIVKENCDGGRIFTIGGTVYKAIVEELFQLKPSVYPDFDFIVERPACNFDHFRAPDTNWQFRKTSFGSPRLWHPVVYIDMLPTDNLDSEHRPEFLSRSVDEKVAHYLRTVPLNIHSIAYDHEKNKVIGDAGIRAIINRVVGVNNWDEIGRYLTQTLGGISLEDQLRIKAAELNFRAAIPRSRSY